MPNLYVTDIELKGVAIADESDPSDVWQLLAESVSRLFDRECEVSDGFFSVADEDPFEKTYRANGTKYIHLSPYVADSIETIVIDGVAVDVDAESDDYYESGDNYLIFPQEITQGVKVIVAARYGFAAIAADIKQACIEQALQLWRKKDLAFADLSGIPAAAINAEFSPTFTAVTKRYRELYSSNTYFS